MAVTLGRGVVLTAIAGMGPWPMQWWVWATIAVVVLILIVTAVLWVQARRRAGGVVVSGRGRGGNRR